MSNSDIQYNISIFTHPGKTRKVNEDSFSVNQFVHDQEKQQQHIELSEIPAPVFCAVFDGMGGERGGRETSQIATALASDFYMFLIRNNVSATQHIGEYTALCTKRIRTWLSDHNIRNGGAAFAAAYLNEDSVDVFSMGDVRVYLYRQHVLRQLTHDHTFAQKKADAGIYSSEQARSHSDSHVLTRFLGMDDELDEFAVGLYEPLTLQEGDRLLICSDGLYDMCSDGEIAAILDQTDAADTSSLVDAALTNGGDDNITCVIIEPLLSHSLEA